MTFNREDLDLLLPQPREPRDRWVWATVTQESPMRIRLDGDDAALLITPESLVGEQAVGRRVWVQLVGRKVIVHGVQFGPEPPGTLRPLAHGSVPPGWLLCDGSAVSRTTYAALFAKIGTLWGVGNGSTTFNLPDGRNRSLIGSSTTRALGTTGGAETVTLTVAQMPSHNHGGATGATAAQVNSQGHHYNNRDDVWASGKPTVPTADATNFPVNMGSTVAHTHAIPAQGGGQAHENMPPYMAGNWIIRT